MTAIELDDETHALVRFAARLFGVSEAEVVARAVRALAESADAPDETDDPWAPVAIYAEYDGRRVDGQYLRATRRLTVTGPPLPGETFTSPSAAAGAVIAALKPQRATAQTNGWRFWRIAATHQRLEVLRQR